MLGKSQINQGLLRVVRSKPFSIFYDLTGCLSPCEPYHSSPLKNGAKPSSTTSSCSVSFTPKLLPAKVMFDTLGYDYENDNIYFLVVSIILITKSCRKSGHAKTCYSFVIENDWSNGITCFDSLGHWTIITNPGKGEAVCPRRRGGEQHDEQGY